MRIALIADIQGNSVALTTVMRHLYKAQVDEIVCLGDVATGVNPIQVLNLLREHKCKVVMGNMDEYVLNPLPYIGDDTNERNYADIDQWCHDQLRPDDLAYIRDFAPIISINLDDEQRLLCCHGSPNSFDDVISATTPESTLQTMLSGYQIDILTTGHMHVQFLRHFQGMVIVSPGSVGLPKPSGDLLKHPLRADYAIITSTKGHLSVDFHRVIYEAQDFKESVLKSNIPHTEWYLAQWDLG